MQKKNGSDISDEVTGLSQKSIRLEFSKQADESWVTHLPVHGFSSLSIQKGTGIEVLLRELSAGKSIVILNLSSVHLNTSMRLEFVCFMGDHAYYRFESDQLQFDIKIGPWIIHFIGNYPETLGVEMIP